VEGQRQRCVYVCSRKGSTCTGSVAIPSAIVTQRYKALSHWSLTTEIHDLECSAYQRAKGRIPVLSVGYALLSARDCSPDVIPLSVGQAITAPVLAYLSSQYELKMIISEIHGRMVPL
jgi:hypothetical protein